MCLDLVEGRGGRRVEEGRKSRPGLLKAKAHIQTTVPGNLS